MKRAGRTASSAARACRLLFSDNENENEIDNDND